MHPWFLAGYDVRFVFALVCFAGGLCFIYVLCNCLHTFVYWCPTRFPYEMVFESFNSSTMGDTDRAENVYPYGAPGIFHVVLWGSCCSIFSFICSVLKTIVCCFVSFLLVIVSSVFRLFTSSDYSLLSSNSLFTDIEDIMYEFLYLPITGLYLVIGARRYPENVQYISSPAPYSVLL